jgi:hypothetical protein
MPNDPTRPLLRLTPRPEKARPVGAAKVPPRPDAFPRERQIGAFGPKFDRLAEVLGRDPGGLELRSDATALASECLLVFEVRGSVPNFAAAIRRAPGLELIDEDKTKEPR